MGEPLHVRWLRGLFLTLVALMGLAVLGVAALAYAWNRHVAPPDVAKIARSAEVDLAARQAAGTLDARLAAAVRPAPWLSPVSTGIEDVCRTEAGAFIGAGYGPVICTRTATRVFGVDSEVARRSGEWDRALRRAGWIGAVDPNTGPSGTAKGPPPIVRYEGAAGVVLTVHWVKPPTDPTPGVPQPYRDRKTEVYRVDEPVDEAAIRQAYDRFRYLVVVAAESAYYDAEAPTPEPTETLTGCRRTDSENCPGG